eukprot:Skav209071  [mRNA]  locus=scaffold4519:13110:19950:- [translate_table: standard]
MDDTSLEGKNAERAECLGLGLWCTKHGWNRPAFHGRSGLQLPPDRTNFFKPPAFKLVMAFARKDFDACRGFPNLALDIGDKLMLEKRRLQMQKAQHLSTNGDAHFRAHGLRTNMKVGLEMTSALTSQIAFALLVDLQTCTQNLKAVTRRLLANSKHNREKPILVMNPRLYRLASQPFDKKGQRTAVPTGAALR